MERSTILVIRPGAIGDSLLALPVVWALRGCYPNPQVMLVGNPAVLPLALAGGVVETTADYGHPRWSELFSTEGPLERSDLAHLLYGTDLAVCWLRDPGDVVRDNLHRLGVKEVIIAPGRPPAEQPMHIVDYLASTVGVKMSWKNLDTITLLRGAIQGVARVDKGRLPIAIHPGSGGAAKCWSVANFARVIERLWWQGQAVLLLAGPADHERLDRLRRELPSLPGKELLTVLVEQPLLEVARCLCVCRGYVGNDSGVTHLAAMLGLPTIALFGPTDPTSWHPVGPAVKVIHANPWERLTVEMVMEGVAEWPG